MRWCLVDLIGGETYVALAAGTAIMLTDTLTARHT